MAPVAHDGVKSRSGSVQHDARARVIADLQAKLDGEIDLKKNEVVSVLDSSTEWCTVETSDGRRGTCPKPVPLIRNSKMSANESLFRFIYLFFCTV